MLLTDSLTNGFDYNIVTKGSAQKRTLRIRFDKMTNLRSHPPPISQFVISKGTLGAS